MTIRLALLAVIAWQCRSIYRRIYRMGFRSGYARASRDFGL